MIRVLPHWRSTLRSLRYVFPYNNPKKHQILCSKSNSTFAGKSKVKRRKFKGFLSVDLLKVTAYTTTRSTTRRSGDQMDDQIAPGDQIGDQIFDLTKMWKSGRPIWSPGVIWLSNEACLHVWIYLRGPDIWQKGTTSFTIWSPGAIRSPRSHLVAGPSGRQSGRGRCIQLK